MTAATAASDNGNAELAGANGGSAADKVSEAIIRGLRNGAFVPGQHLVEPDLTRRLGISRGSLREALKHLAAAGIVTLNRFRGAYITILDRRSVRDLLQTMEALVALAARLAAQHCDGAEQAEAMLAAAAAIEAANIARNRVEYIERRREFYSLMVQIGGNTELERSLPLTRADLFRAQIEAAQSEQQRNLHANGYSRIAQAIAARDPAAAERAVHKHFAATLKTIEDLPAEAFPGTRG